MAPVTENRWVTVAKMILRTVYPVREYDFEDEWPTMDGRTSLFSPNSNRRLRADIGIVRHKSKPTPYRDPADLVAVVEVGDLSSARKLEEWQAVLPADVRVIWMPKLDLLDAVHPGFNKFRFQPPSITKDQVFAELMRQLGDIAKARAQAESATKLVHAAVTEQMRALREAHKSLRLVAGAMGEIADAVNPERWEHVLETSWGVELDSATARTAGLLSGTDETGTMRDVELPS